MRIGRWAWYANVFLWAWSIPLLGLDLVPPGTEWMGTVILVLAGGLCGWWLSARAGARGTTVAALILAGGWGAEHLGVTTGWPFGSYSYTDVLQPQIAGVVPLAIPFAWLLVVPGALELARLLGLDRGLLAHSLSAAVLATLLDIVIEPVAVNINRYWLWVESGPLLGIPTSNFVAWFGLALLLALLARLLLPTWSASDALTPARLALFSSNGSYPAQLYLLHLSLFTAVNLLRGQFGGGLIGLLVLAGLLLALRWQNVLHWRQIVR